MVGKQYAGLMSIIRNPTGEYFLPDDSQSVSEIPPDKLILKPLNGTAKVNAWNFLMLGSIDPNNARMLGLYYVDKDIQDVNNIYDYKIQANYEIQSRDISICGVVQSIGGQYSSLPYLDKPLNLNQLGNTWWEFDEDFSKSHWGKVELSWNFFEQNSNNETWKRFVQPVVYAISTGGNQPRLISPQLKEDKLYFIDQHVNIDENSQYTLIGIDIFGQVSNPLKQSIKLLDKDIPPSPVNLQFKNSVDKIFLKYEYGGHQYLADPDIQSFNIFNKDESIYSQNKIVKYNTIKYLGNTGEGLKKIKINLAEIINPSLFKTVHFINYDEIKLPASKRRKFKIVGADRNSITILTPQNNQYRPEESGKILLEADVRIKNNWKNLNISSPDFESHCFF